MASTLARCQGTGFEPKPMPQRGQRGEDEAASRQSATLQTVLEVAGCAPFEATEGECLGQLGEYQGCPA